MTSTVIADRFHNAYVLAGAGSITPAAADNLALADVSASDVNSKSTIKNTVFNLTKVRQRYQPVRYFSDFATDIVGGGNGFVPLSSGTNASSLLAANDDQGAVGQIRSQTGIQNNGSAFVILSDNTVRLGGGRWFYESRLRIDTLSTSAQRYAVCAGFFDTDLVNFATWTYDEGAIFGNAAAYWQSVTVQASTPTRNQNHTQTTVATATWYRLGVEVNADASEVKFYRDGNLQGTHTTNIPSASGQHLTLGTFILKSVGTTSRFIDIDYILGTVDFTSAR